MNKVFAISAAVVADAIRRKVVWVVVVFAAVLAFAIPALPSYGVGVVVGVFKEVALSLMFAAMFVVTLALSTTRVPAEVERRTVFNVLSRDVARWQYLVGTWVGIAAVTGVALGALTAVSIVAGAVVYQTVLVELFAGALALWFEMCIVAAAALAMSTRFGTVTSMVAAIAFTFIGHSTATLVGADPAPWFVPSLNVFNVIEPVAYGQGYGLTYALMMIAAFAAWSGLLLLAAAGMFKGRDL